MPVIHVACETGRIFENREGLLESVVLVLGESPGYTSVSRNILQKAGVYVYDVGYFEANFDTETLAIQDINALDDLGQDLWR